MNDEILRLLFQRGDFLSGEAISQELGISRGAVWKRINKLKEEGYVIRSVTNRGYKLEVGSGFLQGKLYGLDLETRLERTSSDLWKKAVFAEQMDSTNLEAKRLIREGAEEGTVVICEQQTSGRGRRGRRWESPSGSGLWMSLILKPDIPPSTAPMLTLVAGLAVREALEQRYGLPARIKWPNDIIVGNRKICGILTEMTMEDLEMTGVVIGIGINVSNEAFPAELKEIATSIAMETEKASLDRADLMLAVLDSFERYYSLFLQEGDLSRLTEAYDRVCINVGKTVHVLAPARTYQAEALGISPTGELRIRLSDGMETTVSSGEVTIRGVMGYAE